MNFKPRINYVVIGKRLKLFFHQMLNNGRIKKKIGFQNGAVFKPCLNRLDGVILWTFGRRVEMDFSHRV